MRGRLLCAAAVLALAACAHPRQVWFTPNVGSPDMLDLFARPDDWAKSRETIDVFQFYAGQVLADDAFCPTCGPNRLPNLAAARAFSRLRDWGKGVAIEVAAVKTWDCAAETTPGLAIEAIRQVKANGGDVRYLAMDEPFLSGDRCELSMEEAARRTATFIRTVRHEYPRVEIGDIEPYPIFAAPRLATWLAALLREGIRPAFFHLDVDRSHVDKIQADLPGDLRILATACRTEGLPFGVIFWGDDGTSDEAYRANVLQWIERARAAWPETPDHLVFQSWVSSPDGSQRVPTNLPEDDPGIASHTRLIRDAMAVIRRTTPGGTAP